MPPFVLPFLSLIVLVSFMTTNAIRTTSSMPPKPKRLVFNLVHSKPILSTNDPIHLETNGFYGDDPLMSLLPMTDVWNLFVSFSIGQPPIPQLAIFDTGSKVKWIMCRNNFSYNHLQNTSNPTSTTIFDPSQSTTYKRFPCQDPLCPLATHCATPDSPCFFSANYAQGKRGTGARVEGVLATEQLTFQTYDDGITQVPQVVFGCVDPSTNDDGKFSKDERFNGVFGLGDIAFLANVGGGHPRFSYCIGDVTNPNYTYSHLHLGEDVELDGAMTSLRVSESGRFSVVVISLFLGDEDLNVDPHYFLIDTGATVTYFGTMWFDRIEEKIRYVLKDLGFEVEDRTRDAVSYCYRGSMDDLKRKGFPSLRLDFGDKVEMVLNPPNLFYEKGVTKKQICFAFKPGPMEGMSILGLWPQQGFNIGIDAASKYFYFYNTDCRDPF